EPSMKLAAAIVTNRGGRTCHAAIVSRELGLPAVVGTENASQILKNGQIITVTCAEGEIGLVYEGKLAFKEEHLDVASLLERPKTQIMMNLANPDEAFRLSQIPNDGVGLARIEFIINHAIKIHPMALLRFESLKNLDDKKKIAELTEGYASKPDYFVDKLSQGVAMLGAAFYPKDVIVRFSDFKSNEYAHLIGGMDFEPTEENPMIGFRGASRYYSPLYKEGFALECQAIKKVRIDMGLTNVKVMIPFCRTVAEGRKVLDVMRKHGLVRGLDKLEIYMMCEIPSNVILAEQFAELFDGFSIGSNDLTQLTLGIDRDSEILAEIFDERNEAVKRTIADVISKARKSGTKIGICGQAPSDYPDFAEFLVREHINSISLNPDTLIKTTIQLKRLELEEAKNVNL
ncbi:MAG: phosphoenolpyruvate synthase, partial [Proteobacteria bacterium]|nr:phosphoenolpyruvate synthase [Pseudomonadota bacterium]